MAQHERRRASTAGTGAARRATQHGPAAAASTAPPEPPEPVEPEPLSAGPLSLDDSSEYSSPEYSNKVRALPERVVPERGLQAQGRSPFPTAAADEAEAAPPRAVPGQGLPRGVAKARYGRRIQQREATRARILAAARTVFASQRFHYSTIDDIAALARISRATFYNHFRGKEEVLGAIIMEEHSSTHAIYLELLAAPTVDLAVMTEWVMRVYKLYKSKRKWLFSFYVVCDLYDDMANYFSDVRDEIIDMLGRRFAVFNIPRNGTLQADRDRTRAHLMLYQIEQFALHAVFPGWRMNAHEGAAAVAEQFLAFVAADRGGDGAARAPNVIAERRAR